MQLKPHPSQFLSLREISPQVNFALQCVWRGIVLEARIEECGNLGSSSVRPAIVANFLQTCSGPE
jgi:hypothetical protein